jgi:NCS1 nucleoside transporter family
MVVSSFALGVLAIPIFGLGYVDSAITIVFINFLGILPVCFFSTFGPAFGLRQMVLSRFYFGYYGVKLSKWEMGPPACDRREISLFKLVKLGHANMPVVAVFNVLACLGWSSVNVIVGAQLLNAVNHDMPGWAGILVIALSTLVICAFGYKIVHRYERWSWIPSFIIFMIVLGLFAHSGHFNSLLPLATGPTEAGGVLSFAAALYGFATGWCSYASDYTVYQPSNRSHRLVFACTFIGLFFPLCFTQLLGAAVATATVENENYSNAYFESGIGGLLAAVLVPPLGRFGEFCLVVLALSIIANNCPNIYSVSLSLQVLAKGTQRVPRFIWVAIGTGAYIAIAIPGYHRFEVWLENLMLLVAYWLAIYEGISLTEHFVFRRGIGGYRPEDYMTPSKLPPGYAAITAFAFGVMGVILGMAQVWFTGPIGKLSGGEVGGDVGFEIGFGCAAVSYLGLRTLEKRYFKR